MDIKSNIDPITADIIAALKEIEKKHGVSIARNGKIMYDNAGFILKLAVTQNSETGKSVSREEADWYKNAKYFDLDPNLFGKTFKFDGNDYKIIGLMPRRSKPVLGMDARGRKYLFPSAAVRQAV